MARRSCQRRCSHACSSWGAGYPSVILTRHAPGSTQIRQGRIQLDLESKLEKYLTIDGWVSCKADQDCGQGGVCQANLTCR